MSLSLDLTVNQSAKAFMKRKFTEWYILQVTKQLDSGKPLGGDGRQVIAFYTKATSYQLDSGAL